VLFLVRRLSTRSPLAIFLDDLHEADPASLRLFGHLASELAGSHVLLFGTYRAHGGAYQKCGATVSSVVRQPGAELVTLTGLSPADVALIAEQRTGIRPRSEAIQDIIRKTRGNPFFVIQILKVLENDGRLEALSTKETIEYSIPREVRDAITRQTDVLPTR